MKLLGTVPALVLLLASAAEASVNLDQTTRRLEHALMLRDNDALAAADTHGRNAHWFMLARQVDREEKAKPDKLAFLMTGVKSIASNVPGCPNGGSAADYTCPTAQGTWTYPTKCFGAGGALQGSQTWYAGFTRPPFVVAGCDYGDGATTTPAQMLANPSTYDPAVRSWPAGCTYSATGWPWNTAMPWVNCINAAGTAGTLTFQDLYLGAGFGHKAVGLQLSRSADDVLQNIYISNDADISSITVSGGFRAGQIFMPNGTKNVTFKNVTALGNFNDGSGCCDTTSNNMSLIILNTSGQITFDQVVLYRWNPYMVGINTTVAAGLTIKNTIIHGCAYRTAMGHTECFYGGRGYSQIIIQDNVLALDYNNGTHQSIFHINSTADPASPNGGLSYVRNLVLLKPNSTLNGAAMNGVSFQLNAGVFELTAAIPGGFSSSDLAQGLQVNSAIDPVLGGTKVTQLSLYKQSGSNAYGPRFITDCGKDQLASTWCPVDGVYGNTTTVAATTGGQLTSTAANYVHDWYYVPATGVWDIRDNLIDPSSLYLGFMSSPSDCTGITSLTWSKNINLLTGLDMSGWSNYGGPPAHLGTGC